MPVAAVLPTTSFSAAQRSATVSAQLDTMDARWCQVATSAAASVLPRVILRLDLSAGAQQLGAGTTRFDTLQVLCATRCQLQVTPGHAACNAAHTAAVGKATNRVGTPPPGLEGRGAPHGGNTDATTPNAARLLDTAATVAPHQRPPACAAVCGRARRACHTQPPGGSGGGQVEGSGNGRTDGVQAASITTHAGTARDALPTNATATDTFSHSRPRLPVRGPRSACTGCGVSGRRRVRGCGTTWNGGGGRDIQTARPGSAARMAACACQP